jgi:hypothetical protein
LTHPLSLAAWVEKNGRTLRKKQVPLCVRNDSQKSKIKGKRRSRFPEGMTERKARANLRAKAQISAEV